MTRRRQPDTMTAEEYRATEREVDLQNRIVAAAKAVGFGLIYHTHDSRHSAAGFPDLVMLHRSGRLVVVECKCDGKKPTPKQTEWLDGFVELGAVADMHSSRMFDPPPVGVYVTTPSDEQELIDDLATYASL